MCAPPPQRDSTQLFPASSPAEDLFANYIHPRPTGTAKLAESRNIPLRDISSAYGHMLACTIQEDIPTQLNAGLIAKTMYEAVVAKERPSVNMTRLSKLVSRACDLGAMAEEPMDEASIDELSTLYATMLASSVRLSTLEFDPTALTDTLLERLSNKLLPFPMDKTAYDEAFSDLQDCAANILGTASVDASDKFFKSISSNEHIIDLQNDGYILAISSEDDSVASAPSANETDTIFLALRARLLDGRIVLSAEPSPDDPLQDQLKDSLKISVQNMPPSFACALTGLRVGQRRTVFFHPYAAFEVLPLFLTPEQVPPQAGLVIDFFLLQIGE